jgi:hypothetical protein
MSTPLKSACVSLVGPFRVFGELPEHRMKKKIQNYFFVLLRHCKNVSGQEYAIASR